MKQTEVLLTFLVIEGIIFDSLEIYIGNFSAKIM